MALKANWANGETVDDTAMNNVASAVNMQGLPPTAVKTSAYAAAVGDLIPADATSGGFTVTLPDAPADGSRILIKKIDSSANTVTVQRSGSDVFNVAAGATTLQLVLQDQTVAVQYKTSGGIWYVTAHGAATASLDARYGLASSKTTGMLPPAQVATLGSETFTISGGSVTQIAGTSVQGYSPANGDRILIATAPATTGTGSGYTTSVQPTNGVYGVVNNETNLTVVRAADMSGSVNPGGLSIYVERGDWGGHNVWTVTNPTDRNTHTYGSGAIEIKMTSGISPTFDAVSINNSTSSLSIWNGSGASTIQPTASAGYHTLTLAPGTGILGVKVAVPSTATSAGAVGQWAADASFFYVCTSTNVWRRAAVASW